MAKRTRISKGSEISLDGQGNQIAPDPARDDPIAAAEGALAEFGPIDIRDLRTHARAEEQAATEHRGSHRDSR